ncbi:MAG TPA: sigma factor-like helix-turn-helix DNA-binding protein [Rhodanobacteraceae bacterium]|jgi:RNA polymerase sigma-70 factor (ECF subfamily)|nr:sigma factor-like helix-turn-helix DNA-binding protein [Rhodanobacteraceae bacterium]
MLRAVIDRDPRRDRGPAGRREALDAARQSRYAVQLRRWVQERLPAGTKAAIDAAEWIRDAFGRVAGVESNPALEEGSLLVRLRARLLADDAALRADRARPSSRVEQLVGGDRLEAWENALARMPRRQRELAILRVEFGLGYDEIATETATPTAVARAETVNALAALIDALGTNAGTRRAA